MTTPAAAPAPDATQRRVLIVSASMGAGHDRAAAVLADQLRAHGATARVVDLLALARYHQGDLLRGFYRQLVGRAPAAYDLVMRQWAAHPLAFERLTAAGAGEWERALAGEIESWRPDAVVTTYNLAAQAAGRLRASGRVDVPVLSYVTDPGAHPYWVARGADAHLAPLELTAGALRRLGAAGVVTVAPLVDPAFAPGALPGRDEARQRWSLPPDARLALVNGGSWGVGAAAHTAGVLAAAGLQVVVLCGRSRQLAARLAGTVGVRAVGWTDDVAGLVAASDVVVDNAGGATCWEALRAQRPAVIARPLAGHGRLNAAALAAAGLARAVGDDDHALAAAAATAEPVDAGAVFDGPDPGAGQRVLDAMRAATG